MSSTFKQFVLRAIEENDAYHEANADPGILTQSKLNCAQQCLAKYDFQYNHRLQWERGYSAALQAGNAFDAVGDYAYRTPGTSSDLTPDDATDAWATSWAMAAQDVSDWGDTNNGEVLDQGARAVDRWAREWVPHVTPERTQAEFDLHIEPTDPRARELDAGLELPAMVHVRGKGDVIASVQGYGRAVIDHKMSGRRFTEKRVRDSVQANLYSLALGIPQFQFHVAVRKKKPEVQVAQLVTDPSTDQHVASLFGTVRRQLAVCAKYDTWPTNRSHTLCTKKYCPFANACEKRNGGTIPA